MRMLKSGLKLVLDTDWIFNDNDEIEDIVVHKNTYNGVKYWQEGTGHPILSNFDVKLPLNHRYVVTYWNWNNEFATTVYFNTFGVEEQYQASVLTDAVGFQAVGVWYYNIDAEEVGGDAISFIICDQGIRLSTIYMGNYNIRIYQLD